MPQLIALIRQAARSHPGKSDADLLGRFADAADGDAFAELVHRYAAMVWGQCRNLLASEADADDAFQATFLALARSTKTIHSINQLGPWLHAVAYRICLNVRRANNRRTNRERAVASKEASVPVADFAWDAMAATVHEEVNRLPESLRVPFVLCCLEGKAPTNAAKQLGLKWSTFSSRLTKAKRRLQDRLSARGIGAAVVVASGAAILSASLVTRTILICSTGARVPAPIQSLCSEVLSMNVSRAMLLSVVAVLVAAVGFLPGILWLRMPTAPMAMAAMAAPEPKESLEVKTKKLEELWSLLLSREEAVSSRAMLELSARPKADAVIFLAEKLKPLTLTEDRARKLLADLGSEKEQVVNAAFEELSVFDPRLVLEVGDILKDVPDGVHRQRIVALLLGQAMDAYAWCLLKYKSSADVNAILGFNQKFPGQIQIEEMPNKPADVPEILKGSTGISESIEELSRAWSGQKQWSRMTRAVMILEHFGTPDAVKVIERVASGHMDASPTKAAKEALGRLNKK
jgi:RNA polymerase sigma factor (sigma-70 family)